MVTKIGVALLCLLLLLPRVPWSAAPSEWVSRRVSWATCVGSAGTTNTSTTGAGTDVTHGLSCTLTANMLKANGVVNACALVVVTGASTVPSLQMKIKAGSTALAVQSAFTPLPSTTVNAWYCAKTVARAAPGPSVATDTSFVTYPSATAFGPDSNTLAQPVSLATNGALVWTFTSQWLTNTGTGSSLTLASFFVTVTN